VLVIPIRRSTMAVRSVASEQGLRALSSDSDEHARNRTVRVTKVEGADGALLTILVGENVDGQRS